MKGGGKASEKTEGQLRGKKVETPKKRKLDLSQKSTPTTQEKLVQLDSQSPFSTIQTPSNAGTATQGSGSQLYSPAVQPALSKQVKYIDTIITFSKKVFINKLR